MNPKTIAIVNKSKGTDATGFQKILDKVTGTIRVNNGNNPNSASYKMSQSVGQPNPNDPSSQKKFKSTGKTYGVGVK